MKLSVIVPVHNGGDDLRQCLHALQAGRRRPDELIVVDDASTDDSAMIASAAGARVLALSGAPSGPGVARNRGAEAARGDVLVFIDADVAVHDDTLARIELYLTAQPEIAGLFGSYDDRPPAAGTVSHYKNLMHHYVHQHSQREAATFWAGCGAVRRDVFLAAGGFDTHYGRPSIEDIELGVRLHAQGVRLWLCPDVQVTHLKRWTLRRLLRSDIYDRAIPWTQLILNSSSAPADLNLDQRSRLSAVVAWLGPIALVLGVWQHTLWFGLPVLAAVLAALNIDLYRFFWRRGGLSFALAAAGLHALYLLYSSFIFGWLLVWHVWQNRGQHKQAAPEAGPAQQSGRVTPGWPK